jgi:hypothetical protein
MLKKIVKLNVILVLLILVFPIVRFSVTNANINEPDSWIEKTRIQSTLRKVQNDAFTVGEWLRFNISYGFIHAGTATMAIPDYTYINHRQCYHIKTEAFSASGFNWIFKVEDKYESHIDVEGIFPWRFERHIKEGKYKSDDAADFDQYWHFAKTKDSTYSVPEYVHDILSAFYFVRTQDFSSFKAGDKIHLKNFFKDKVYNLDIKYLGKLPVDVDAGTFSCIIVEPLLTEGGLFKHQGRMLIWLTDDDRKIPVKVTTGIFVGSINIELESYAGIKGPLNAKK